MGGGQDKPAWTACPPGVKITRAGGKISRDSLPPGGQVNRGWLAPRGASCPGGKINWDTGISNFRCFAAQTMPEYWLIVIIAELSRPDIGENKFDGTVRQKLGVGK